jgi:DUF1365 family protein
MSSLFPPPVSAAMLYPGKVMHARLHNAHHRFNYRVLAMMLDLDRLNEAQVQSRFFSVNRFNLYSFYEKDHGPCDGSSLAGWVREQLQPLDLTDRAERILLLCYPRILGYVFNPISVFFIYDDEEKLVALIYEVRNTFGGKHAYVHKVQPGQMTPAGIRQEQDKLFYVSPFLPMNMRYHFRVVPPGECIKLRIFETQDGKPALTATFAGYQKNITAKHLVTEFMRIPFVTLKIILGIHYEALRLWWKGAPYMSRKKVKGALDHKVTIHSSDR